MGVNSYVPADVSLAFGGYVLTGWNTISIQRNYPVFTAVDGIRGKNTRTRNRNTSATIKFSCLQTGEANDLLSGIVTQDYELGNGRISLTLTDNSGSSLFFSSEAYITGYADAVFSEDFEYRVWTIQCASSEGWNVGGNLEPANSLFSKVTGFVGDTIGSLF
jgi:hypothetical protein